MSPPVSRKELRRRAKEIRTLERAGDTDAARAMALELAAQYGANAEARVALGELYARLGETERAAVVFREAWELEPRTRKWKIARRVARGLSAAGQDQEALELLRPLDAVMAAGPVGRERALLLRRLGRLTDAVAELSRTLGEDPYFTPAWDELLDVLAELDRPDELAEARRRWAAVPRKRSTTEVMETITRAFPATDPYVVNLGCRDGKVKDPCYELYRRGHPGLAVDAGDFPQLHVNLPQPDVRKLLNTKLTPDNVVDILRREGCPPRPALLKIDIDSFDGPLLAAALDGIEPEVIRIEVNPDFPPPLRFAVEYDPDYAHSGTAGFFGCSLSYVLSVCRPRGYELLEIDFSKPKRGQDALLVAERLLGLFGVEPPVDERDLFLREPYGGWRGLVEIGVDTRAWRSRTDFEALAVEARAACAAASLHRSGRVTPFLLDCEPG